MTKKRDLALIRWRVPHIRARHGDDDGDDGDDDDETWKRIVLLR